MVICQNPILPGFYPDPSVCRVGDDFYLVTSSFAYFPGVPIFHSRDLVHWNQLGHVLNRQEQLPLNGSTTSRGIFAPTIRYHDGIFYMITTNIDHGGNFIVTAKRPEGPWSEPYFLKDADGIDPSLFFDDGRAYYIGTRDRREGPQYYGDNEIWLQELELSAMRLVGERYALWHGALKNAVWPEGPHLYKHDGWYYLLIAEGGTCFHHAVTVARSRTLTGGYEGNAANPILTHRHLGRSYPVVNAGHGELVDTPNGDWYMTVLASRPYGGYYRNLGRETFLARVEWEDGWPVVSPGVGRLEESFVIPALEPAPVTKTTQTDMFAGERLGNEWIHLRNPRAEDYSLTERPNRLRLTAADGVLTAPYDTVSFAGVRQRHMNFSASVRLEFEPRDGESAGLVAYQNHNYHYQLVCTHTGGERRICLLRCENDVLTELAACTAGEKELTLRIEAEGQCYRFYAEYEDGEKLRAEADGRILSTDVAGGFVGTVIGLYATGNGSKAYFGEFKYKGE